MVLPLAPNAFAQGGVPLWTNRYDGGFGTDHPRAMAVDANGDVIVTGESDGELGYFDYVTIKYSSAGVPLWTNRYDGPGNAYDFATAVGVDNVGNVFVTGYSAATNEWPYGYDYVTIKYSSNGVPLWTNRFDGAGNGDDEAHALAVDTNGNVVVTGTTDADDLQFDYATILYSGAGEPLWTNQYNGLGNDFDRASAVAVDAQGRVFVTGWSSGGVSVDYDYATIGYSSAGEPLWTNRYNGPASSQDYAHAVAVDSNGTVLVTGISTDANWDYATIAYSISGFPLWTNRYSGPGDTGEEAAYLKLDDSGNVFVAGRSGGDYATLKYSGAGASLWTNRYNGPGSPPFHNSDYARAIAVDKMGNVFVTGRSDMGNGFISDYATLGYSSGGLPLWTNRYNEPGFNTDGAFAVAVDKAGNVLVTGVAWDSSLPRHDIFTIKYSSSIAPPVQLALEPDSSSGYFIRFNGGPGFTYRLQRANDLTGSWTNLATNTAPVSGLVEFHDPSPPSTGAFYRTQQP